MLEVIVMDYTMEPYRKQFTVDDRKALIAQSIVQMRKGSGLSQKEVAAAVGVAQATYSAYERGRNEPPAEVLVRLSYLFKVPVDVLVQKERLHKTSDDAQRQIEELKQQLKDFEEQFAENGGDNPVAMQFLKAMGQLADQMELLNNSSAAQQQYNSVNFDE